MSKRAELKKKRYGKMSHQKCILSGLLFIRGQIALKMVMI